MNTEPFFIVGLGRSGTTLLRLMMNSHPHIAIPYESHFITNYHKVESQYGTLDNSKNLDVVVEKILSEELLQSWDHTFEKSKILNDISVPVTIGGIFNAVYQDYAVEKNKKRWGDKSDYLDRMHIINDIFPNAKFIHIIRDGRDVATSVMKMTWGPRDILQAADWWQDHIKVAQMVGSVLGKDRYMTIRYEDLVENPEAQLKRTCAFLGEDFYPEMLEYHREADSLIPDDRKHQHANTNTPPNVSRCFAWKKEMSAINQAIFAQSARQTLLDLDYEVPDLNVSNTKLKIHKLKTLVKRQIG